MDHRNRLLWRILLSPLTALFMAVSSMPCSAQHIHVEPQSIKIGSFFGGTHLKARGEVPEGNDVVIEVLGKDIEEELMRKGSRWELWMNVGEVDIGGVPRLYFVASSNPQLLKQPAETVPWGYEALEKRAVFRGRVKEGEESHLFEQFVQLKESQGLYGIFPGTVKLSSDAELGNTGEAVFQLNSRISPGSYRVCIWTARNGLILKQECAPFTVTIVGIPAYLSSLATEQPIFYGLLAVAMGIVLGLLSGILFTRKRREENRSKPSLSFIERKPRRPEL